eukprot:202002-Amphidinium_carterae.1
MKAHLRSVVDQQQHGNSPRPAAPARTSSKFKDRRAEARAVHQEEDEGVTKLFMRTKSFQPLRHAERREGTKVFKRGRNLSEEFKRAKNQGICFDWLKGKCKRGDQCKYKHENPTPSPAAASPS